MEVKNKVIHYNIDNIAQQMNAQKPAGYRQDGGRHSVSQSHRNPTNASGQIRRDDQSGIENANHLNNAINEIRDSLKNALLTVEEFMNRGISLEIERELGVIIVKIIDRESGELVRQVPFEDALEISKHLKAQLEETVMKSGYPKSLTTFWGSNQGGLFIDKEI
jgi:flagellar protein FlaG